MKPRILFVAEHITLAQVVRLAVLAGSLDQTRYEVHFASSGFPPMVFGDVDFFQHPLETLDTSAVEAALAGGKRIYEKKTLQRYIEAELELIARVKPQLIVGDFRLSLSISAPLSGVPHASLINAYWSPYRTEPTFPVPDHPIIRWLGEELTEQYFPKALPRVFEHFAAPVNAMRKRYGLAPVGSLQRVLTHGDYTLYPDVECLVPTRNLPPQHRYLGPVLWSPRVEFDESLLAATGDRRLVYVTLGSSGKLDVLPVLLQALARLPVQVVLATAGRTPDAELPPNVRAYPFVPGDLLARHAALVISNGGSTTGYQALSQGTPVLGIASNLDQYLAMQVIERAGAGVLVKARSVSVQRLEEGVFRLLNDRRYTEHAVRISRAFSEQQASRLFPEFVEELLPTGHFDTGDAATVPAGAL